MIQGLSCRDSPLRRQLQKFVQQIDAIRRYFVSHEGIKLFEALFKKLLAR
jgi:hypothetical protein